jgi:hypothetical protein
MKTAFALAVMAIFSPVMNVAVGGGRPFERSCHTAPTASLILF